MAAEQRKLLEQLMGEQLMGGGASASSQLSLTDAKVCRSYLAGTCPHDLFTNTKQDLGPCPKVHSENLKTEYDGLAAPEKQRYAFEYDYMRDMHKYIDDCNRRIDTAQRRLEKTPDEIRQTNALLKQITDLTHTINTGLLEIRILGETGAVSSAVAEHHKVRVARTAKEDKERELRSLADTSGPSGHQKLQVRRFLPSSPPSFLLPYCTPNPADFPPGLRCLWRLPLATRQRPPPRGPLLR